MNGSRSQGNIIFQVISSYDFPGQSIKVITQHMCEKASRIYSMYDRLLTFLWRSLHLTPSSCRSYPPTFS